MLASTAIHKVSKVMTTIRQRSRGTRTLPPKCPARTQACAPFEYRTAAGGIPLYVYFLYYCGSNGRFL